MAKLKDGRLRRGTGGYAKGCVTKYRDGWEGRKIGGYVKEWVAK